MTQAEQWSRLAAEAQAGNKASYNQLLSEIFPYIRNSLVGGLANPDWADDIAQEVLISVHKSLHTYSGDKPFKPWLMAITNFRRTDFLRKHYAKRADKQAPIDVLEFSKEYVTHPEHAGEYKDIEKALQSLPEQQRKIFEMIKIHGFTAKEVANETGMSVSAVKVSAHRTTKKIRAILKK